MSKKPWRAGKDLASVVENMEIGTGQRGDGKDAFVTQRQLAELKLAKMRAGSGGIRLTPGLGQGGSLRYRRLNAPQGQKVFWLRAALAMFYLNG
ncbi:hypothetical protein [Citrobacter amalonaticus]|uniref:hypothetical protein n=1 Tax=Citrobacter amalonaticus TaxID=35703 RepID=UPI00269EC8E1